MENPVTSLFVSCEKDCFFSIINNIMDTSFDSFAKRIEYKIGDQFYWKWNFLHNVYAYVIRINRCSILPVYPGDENCILLKFSKLE